MDVLYDYVLDWSKGSKRRHVDDGRSFIERFIRLHEFKTLFGGEMLLTDPNGRSEFIGVWGRKARTDFKRSLRDEGPSSQCYLANASGRVVKRHSQYRIRPARFPPQSRTLTVDTWPAR